MKSRNSIYVICAIVLPTAVLTGGAKAWAQGVAPPLGGSVTTHFLTGGGWDIFDDATGGPQEVIRDPNGQPWAKDLTGPGPSPPQDLIAMPGDTFTITEHLIIGGALDWADWHEEILDPNWDFVGPIDFLVNGSTASGLSFSTMPSTTTQGGSIWFNFDPVASGALIDVVKSIQYVGGPGQVFQGTVRMLEYPTPEPASLALLGVSGLALLRVRRRQGRRT